ncbi:recombinase family protein [Pectobacterium versatile]|uniref:Recombinase family protein n=1 Tax=Pectobacterium versatile TaxID=2488639 RepID=A0AAW3RYG8_9GAMM|nr:recombinase family protein [Pectobacterium versatile]MBA0160929.1 recombinase family protein [Pectobacterium versatile]
MNIRIYCRASTAEQHADRALQSLQTFAEGRGWHIKAEYIENASGAALARPELIKLLEEAEEGDVLLVESIDRLSRLSQDEWAQLKQSINDNGLRIVAMDLPTSWQALDNIDTGVTGGILRAVNNMLIDILATMARADYETRRKRQAQGIERAKADGKYTGRTTNDKARETVKEMLSQGIKPEYIMKAAEISRATFYRIKREIQADT